MCLRHVQESTMYSVIFVFIALLVSTYALKPMRSTFRSMTLQAKAKSEVGEVIEERPRMRKL